LGAKSGYIIKEFRISFIIQSAIIMSKFSSRNPGKLYGNIKPITPLHAIKQLVQTKEFNYYTVDAALTSLNYQVYPVRENLNLSNCIFRNAKMWNQDAKRSSSKPMMASNVVFAK
jgi:hypothetical protein